MIASCEVEPSVEPSVESSVESSKLKTISLAGVLPLSLRLSINPNTSNSIVSALTVINSDVAVPIKIGSSPGSKAL